MKIKAPVFQFSRTLALRGRIMPNLYDVLVLITLIALFIAASWIAKEMGKPLIPQAENASPIVLDPWNLFEYGGRTTMRMFIGIFASLLFTFIIAPIAAKSRRAEMIIIPALDFLQSVPVLGFLSFTVLFFLSLFPGSQMGAEGAAIFAIFTAQVWNMTFSFYQSLRTIPKDLNEVSIHLGLSPWMRFWKLEVPFSAPGLVWNTMMSMSGGWFFLVASESIIANNSKIILPGIGAWLALAIDQQDVQAVLWAVFAMAVVIVLYNQLIFSPVLVWIDKFKMEDTEGQSRPKSWVYNLLQRTYSIKFLSATHGWIKERLATISLWGAPPGHKFFQRPFPKQNKVLSRTMDFIWITLLLLLLTWAARTVYEYIYSSLYREIVIEALWGCLYTFLRVAATLIIASLIWVPIGVWLGIRPWAAQRSKSISQFLAAFPANIFFPFFVIVIVKYSLNPDIWLSPLMMLGAQWYIFFNVVAGASAFPNDLKEVSALYHIRTWNWWRKVMLPGIFPYYITGGLTAWGGAWNASIVAEYVSWGPTKLEALGIGSFIAKASEAEDYPKIVLGLFFLTFIVITVNRLLWRKLYNVVTPQRIEGKVP